MTRIGGEYTTEAQEKKRSRWFFLSSVEGNVPEVMQELHRRVLPVYLQVYGPPQEVEYQVLERGWSEIAKQWGVSRGTIIARVAEVAELIELTLRQSQIGRPKKSKHTHVPLSLDGFPARSN